MAAYAYRAEFNTPRHPPQDGMGIYARQQIRTVE